MKRANESEALRRLGKIRNAYREQIKPYEAKAKDCQTCETRGACCLDAHFVNVHITRLEAVAIRKLLRELDEGKQDEIKQRISGAIEKFHLTDYGDTFKQTFACPLFEKERGCLVHSAKPVPCIQHACYDFEKDLPPDQLQLEVEKKIERLNKQTYFQSKWLPLPIWLEKLN